MVDSITVIDKKYRNLRKRKSVYNKQYKIEMKKNPFPDKSDEINVINA